MEETQEQSEEIIPGIEATTAHDHFYEAHGINENNLLDVICDCGHGMQVDSGTRVEYGKLIAPSV